MKKLKVQSIKKRKLVKKLELVNFLLRLIRLNINLNQLILLNFNYSNSSYLFKRSSRHVLTNRCIYSNKNSIISKYFRLSRFFFLKFSRFNLIYGIKKFYW